MEECKFCKEELPEGVSICPACGRNNAAEEEPTEETAEQAEVNEELPEAPEEVREEAAQVTDISDEAQEEQAQKQEKKPASKLEIAILVVLIAVLAALVGVLISQHTGKKTAPAEEVDAPAEVYTIPADGNPGDITCKGSYTVSDEELAANRDKVVATCGDAKLTVGLLQTYYWMEVRTFLNAYGAYAAYFGMDMSRGLDTQMCGIAEGVTWQQYFLESALNSWQTYQAMAHEAKATGTVLSDEIAAILASLDADLEEATKAGNFSSVENMLSTTMGPGATAEEYKEYMTVYYTGYGYYQDWALTNVPTADEIAAYFAEHEADYADNGITKDTVTVDVRHILLTPEETESESGEKVITEEAWSGALAQANDVLQEFNDGEKTESSFAELAKKYTQDPGSASTGGLYTGVTEGQMVPEFNDWCFDTARKAGDRDIVKTSYGYHVMYFVARNTMWEKYAESDLSNERSAAFVEGVAVKYPIDVDFGELMLGSLKLA